MHRKQSQAQACFHSEFLNCCRLGFVTLTFCLGFLGYIVNGLKLEKAKEKPNSPKRTIPGFVLCEGPSGVPGLFVSKFPRTYFQPERHRGQVLYTLLGFVDMGGATQGTSSRSRGTRALKE